MGTYIVDNYERSIKIEIRAKNIDNIRKRVIREYDYSLKRGDHIYINRAIKLTSGRTGRDCLGSIHYHDPSWFGHNESDGAYYWLHGVDGRTMRSKISPKTGKIYDTKPA